MLSRRSRAISPMVSSPRSLRTTLPPSGSGQAGLAHPPLAEVDDLVEALVLVEELPLVDDQADVDLPLGDGREDLVEGHDLHLHVLAQAELEREVGRGQLAGDGDGLPPGLVEGHRLAGDELGPVLSPMLQPEASRA